METGLLWYEPNAKMTLEQKVQGAVDYYTNRMGHRPSQCHVHPSLLPSGSQVVAGVLLRGNKTIIKNHFWLGIGDE